MEAVDFYLFSTLNSPCLICDPICICSISWLGHLMWDCGYVLEYWGDMYGVDACGLKLIWALFGELVLVGSLGRMSLYSPWRQHSFPDLSQ